MTASPLTIKIIARKNESPATEHWGGRAKYSHRLATSQILAPEFIHSAEKMDAGRGVGNPMFSHRVNHQLEKDVLGNQLVDEGLFVLGMNIVVVSSINNHQMTGK